MLLDKNVYTRITRSTNIDNKKITLDFLKYSDSPNTRKSHLFGGRYENIYLNEEQIPALSSLINEATQLAQNILKVEGLRAGYWFNYMPPESTTTLHTHDDDDELLSAVYYVDVPENSGNLIIYQDSEKIEITPKIGDFIFFKPDVQHEVSRNNSPEYRLSIGMNFGINK
jgi:hypothetical protein